ncbi:hypothetical protein RQP46_002474 [Phenoliferia psychrophenolica]
MASQPPQMTPDEIASAITSIISASRLHLPPSLTLPSSSFLTSLSSLLTHHIESSHLSLMSPSEWAIVSDPNSILIRGHVSSSGHPSLVYNRALHTLSLIEEERYEILEEAMRKRLPGEARSFQARTNDPFVKTSANGADDVDPERWTQLALKQWLPVDQLAKLSTPQHSWTDYFQSVTCIEDADSHSGNEVVEMRLSELLLMFLKAGSSERKEWPVTGPDHRSSLHLTATPRAHSPPTTPGTAVKILEIANEQEQARQDRVTDPAELEGHINCLSSLALVCRELRQLVAEYQFRVLHVKKVSATVFRYRILPHFGHHITAMTFYGAEKQEEAELALTLMSQLPALCVLRFDHWTAEMLFGPDVTLRPDLEDEGISDRASVLITVAPRIQALTLLYFEPSRTVALIRAFANLPSLRNLRSLIIEMEEGVGCTWPIEALATLARDPPPLISLDLLKFPLNHHTLHFIKIFASTIEGLGLDIEPQDPTPDLTSLDPIKLPRLTSLELVTFQPQLADLVRILNTASPLTHFSLYSPPHGAVVDPTDPTLLALVDAQPSLRHLWLWDVNLESVPEGDSPSTILPSPSFLSAYADLVRSRPGLDDENTLDQYHLTPFHPNAKLDHVEDEIQLLTGALRRTLEFGLDEVNRMEAEGNVAKAVSWVPKLKALDDERWAWWD